MFYSLSGMYLGSGDYFTHVKSFSFINPFRFMSGYDFHKDTKQNRTTGYKYYGEYSTHVFGKRAQNIIKTHKAKSNKVRLQYN